MVGKSLERCSQRAASRGARWARWGFKMSDAVAPAVDDAGSNLLQERDDECFRAQPHAGLQHESLHVRRHRSACRPTGCVPRLCQPRRCSELNDWFHRSVTVDVHLVRQERISGGIACHNEATARGAYGAWLCGADAVAQSGADSGLGLGRPSGSPSAWILPECSCRPIST